MNLTHTLNRLLTRLEHSIANSIHLTAATFSIVAQITGLADAFYKAESLQVKSLALGLDLKKVITENKDSLDALPNLAIIPLQEQLKLLDIGLKQPNKSLLELATVMRLTNQNSDLLIENMSLLASIGGISNRQMGSLAEELNKTSNTYKISLDNLDKTISQLGNALPDLNLFGNTAVVEGALARVVGSFGALFTPQISRLIGIMVAGSDEAINQLSRLGIRQQAFNLTQAGTIGEAEASIRSAIFNMADQSSLIANSFKQLGPQGASLARSIYGDAFDIGLSLSKALENGYGQQKELGGKLENYTNSIQALTQAYIEPLQRLATNILPPMIDALIALRVPLLGLASVLAVESASRLGASLLGGLVRGFSLPGLLASVALGLVGAFAGDSLFGNKEDTSNKLKDIAKNTKDQVDLQKEEIASKTKTSNDVINRLIADTLNSLMDGNATAIAKENDRFYEMLRLSEKMHTTMEEGNRLLSEQTGVIEKAKPVTNAFTRTGRGY